MRKILYNIPLLENLEEEPNVVYVPTLKAELTNTDEKWTDFFSEHNIIEWRLVMAEHTDSTRTVKAQGLVLPTIFNLSERYTESCYYTPLWNLSALTNAKHNSNIEILEANDYAFKPFNFIDPSVYDTDGLLPTIYEKKIENNKAKTGVYLHSIKAKISADRAETILTQDSIIVDLYLKVAIDSNTTYDDTTPIRIVWSHRAFGQGKKVCKEAYSTISLLKWKNIENNSITYNVDEEIKIKDIEGINLEDYIFKGAEFPSEETLINNFVPFSDFYRETRYLETPWIIRHINYEIQSENIKKHENEYFIDANVCNFISPDFKNVESGYKFRLIGTTSISNTLSDYNIKSEDSVDEKGFIVKASDYNFNLFTINNYNERSNREIYTGLIYKIDRICTVTNSEQISNSKSITFKLLGKELNCTCAAFATANNYELESTAERKARRNKDIKTMFQYLTIQQNMPFMQAYEIVGYHFYESADHIRRILRTINKSGQNAH